jgi:hypothetical protein
MQIAREARAAQRKVDFDEAVSEGRLQVRQMTKSERAASDIRRGERAAEGESARSRRY